MVIVGASTEQSFTDVLLCFKQHPYGVDMDPLSGILITAWEGSMEKQGLYLVQLHSLTRGFIPVRNAEDKGLVIELLLLS